MEFSCDGKNCLTSFQRGSVWAGGIYCTHYDGSLADILCILPQSSRYGIVLQWKQNVIICGHMVRKLYCSQKRRNATGGNFISNWPVRGLWLVLAGPLANCMFLSPWWSCKNEPNVKEKWKQENENRQAQGLIFFLNISYKSLLSKNFVIHCCFRCMTSS